MRGLVAGSSPCPPLLHTWQTGMVGLLHWMRGAGGGAGCMHLAALCWVGGCALLQLVWLVQAAGCSSSNPLLPAAVHPAEVTPPVVWHCALGSKHASQASHLYHTVLSGSCGWAQSGSQVHCGMKVSGTRPTPTGGACTCGLDDWGTTGRQQGGQTAAPVHVCVASLFPPPVQPASSSAGGTHRRGAPLRRPPACSCPGTQVILQLWTGYTSR